MARSFSLVFIDEGHARSCRELSFKGKSSMAGRRCIDAMAAGLYEHYRMSSDPLNLTIDVVNTIFDPVVSAEGVNIIVCQRFHGLETAVLRSIFGDGHDQAFIVIFVASPGNTLVRIVPRMIKIVNQKPVCCRFHRGVVHIGL